MRRKKRGFVVSFIIVILCIALFFVGGYFLLDKVVVPKYFGEYGIHDMSGLVGMMRTLYSSPDEDKIIKNGFNEFDLDSGEEKLKLVFPTKENGNELDYSAISDAKMKDGIELPLELEFTDKEIASVVDEMLMKGILAKKLPNLEYINTLTINVLELIITPEELSNGFNPDSANIHAYFKIDTTNVREQMAKEMGTSLFLLNMIIPDTLYVSVDYTLELADDGWTYSNGNISLNGRTAKQSEILLNLLISFIFPAEDEMNIDKLTNEFGNILQSGLDMLGRVEYVENGIIVTVE